MHGWQLAEHTGESRKLCVCRENVGSRLEGWGIGSTECSSKVKEAKSLFFREHEREELWTQGPGTTQGRAII